MQRTLDNIQELGFRADNGCYISTEIIASVAVSAIRKYQKDDQGREIGGRYRVNFIVKSARTDKTLAIVEQEYITLEELMDDLGIDDIDEVWEIID